VRKELGDQRPAGLQDSIGECPVGSGVYVIDAGAHHSDGSSTALERRLVSSRIDSGREPRHHREASLDELSGESSGPAFPFI
jgi:hypothetical protein